MEGESKDITTVQDQVRDRLALALDVDDRVEALRLARQCAPWFGVAKVGLELFTTAGPGVIGELQDAGFTVFVDLKLHDIPTTVERAARVLGSLGAGYATMHAHGGVPMLRAGVEGLREGARSAGLADPVALAVTVLTTDKDAPPHIVPKRTELAMEAGCGGVVCAAGDLPAVRALAPAMVTVVPGIRPAGAASHDQVRAVTPEEAVTAGARVLVVGRPVTRADDPAAAAAAIARAVAAAVA